MTGKPRQNKAKGPSTRSGARPAAAKQSVRRTRAEADSPYHHGALRDALLQTAEKILERDGLPGLTLRAVAREAGVSHAAPTHHFGDLTGLLSELAAIGFRQFGAAMVAAGAAGSTPMEKGLAQAKSYIAYARAHPGMHGLMFRTERLDHSRPALREAADASFAGFATSIAAGRQERYDEQALSLDQAAAIVRAWSLVHGFTTLLLDGRLTDILERLPKGTTVDMLLDAMLKSAIVRPPGSARV